MDSFLDDNEFEHIIDKDQVDHLELELQGLIGKGPQPVMECGEPELPSSSGASSVRPTDEKMDAILDDDEFDQWMIKHVIDKDQVDQLELELQGLIGKRPECGEPELKKRKLERNHLPSSSGASSVEKDRQNQPSSYLVEPHKLKGEKRRNRRMPSINLSSLIDNNVVSLGEKARYLNKKDNRVMAEGWVMHEGIRCSCCKNVYCLSKFEVHAGSSSHRPTANIFLEDGRSLLQCQAQIKNGDEVKGFEQNPHPIIQKMESDVGVEGFTGYLHEHMERNQAHPLIQQIKVDKKDCRITIAEEMKSKISCCRGNGICHICLHQGVGLLVCEGECLRMFHLSCIGLEGFPESVWFCPSCACGLCGGGEYNNENDQFEERTIVYCDQCERRYHVGCLRERGVEGLESRPKGNWFCKEKCAEIFFHLQNFLGRSNPTGIKDLSWTILRSNEKDGHDLHTSSYIEAMTKHKLVDARAVLRDCYGRIVQPVTKTNLIKDIVFSKESKLPYQNYQGFYTMILDRGKKPISVATFRVHGDKVAEVPLLGTRVMSRRQGMASLLMNNLQKILSDMGVQKLILPIAPKFLQSWTTSYGFSKATNSDRFELLECPFIEFINNMMCQKILIKPAI
ncbi:increased DNA methylation 1-like [Magnolia sinica]|uniref:increased DNA methylation 1-like n=1 Tax=Magnolia sinica TaxID=86752 RepID=UPI0026583637|nr:increased DNA methylation 1-like [Magnolia sinica]